MSEAGKGQYINLLWDGENGRAEAGGEAKARIHLNRSGLYFNEHYRVVVYGSSTRDREYGQRISMLEAKKLADDIYNKRNPVKTIIDWDISREGFFDIYKTENETHRAIMKVSVFYGTSNLKIYEKKKRFLLPCKSASFSYSDMVKAEVKASKIFCTP